MATHSPMTFQPVEGDIAIVGGGIAGVVAAQKLAEVHEVVLFDFGSRGLGGRCGHREDRMAGSRFDHGAQFLSVGPGDAQQWKDLISSWLSEGLLDRWTPRLLELGEASCEAAGGDRSDRDPEPTSFFDVLTATELYVSPGGMRNLCEGLASKGQFRSVRGCRVRRLEKRDDGEEGGLWSLYGNPGNQAHHEVSELDAQAADDQYLGSFKTVVLSDVMLSFPSWHRAALLGLEAAVPELVELLRHTEMAPLFSLMVSFEAGATEKLDVDAAVVRHDVLQWVCRMSSKPGTSLTQDCWVCVSTRSFAEACLKDEPMSMAVEGVQGRVYKPQEKDYLSADPADVMLKAFFHIFQLDDLDPISKQCQRWGAAYVHQGPPYPSRFEGPEDGHDGHGRCLIDRVNSIAVCGDFLLTKGPRGGMSSAYSSAMSASALADALLQTP